MEEALNILEQELLAPSQKEFEPAFIGPIDEWAHRNVDLPKVTYKPSGPFDVNISRHFIRPFQQLRNRSLRQLNIMASPRSGKTLIGEIFLVWAIATSPGNALWVQASGDVMDRMTATRIQPIMKMCPSVSKMLNLKDRTALTQKRAKFSNGMHVDFDSAKQSAFLGSGYRYVIFDEVWQAAAGLIGQAQSRVGDFPDYKILLISQGSDQKHPEWEQEFNRAPVWEWGWTCERCGTVQVLTFNKKRDDEDPKSYGGLQWDRTEHTYDFTRQLWYPEEAAKTVRLECINPKCKFHLQDTVANREDLNNKGLYVCTKSDGNPVNESIRWNALADRKVAFEKLAYEYCEAYNQEHRTGITTLKINFRQQREAMSWGTEFQAPSINILNEEYDPETPWIEEETRMLTVDTKRSAPHFWFVARAWAANGDSRKLEHGFCDSWEQLDDIRNKWGIKHHRVILDSGDGVMTNEVYDNCASHGTWITVKGGKRKWKCYLATHGDKVRYSEHKQEDGTVLSLPWRPEVRKPAKLPKDPLYSGVIGCPFVSFSDFNISSMLEHLLKGKGPKFICGSKDDEYEKQLGNFQRVETNDGKKRTEQYTKLDKEVPNEYFDCEKLQVLGAAMCNILTTLRYTKPKNQAVSKD